ncbi:disease resistance protein RGA5 isoform X2 [Triticum aestivum]|uniref:disease resistance protein RGA5 isoform X2 n=1 Tax=Triticum aestivum TaxID=4565 RepID=UPI001D019A99|nr:disease resistance protein RGA5-like isoform X2 [Triticum aestivum]
MEREIVEADESPEHEQARIELVGRAIGDQPPTPFPTARDKGRGILRETEGPISASLGTMRPLIGKLDMLLLAPPRGCSSKKVMDMMRLLRDDVEKINSCLSELSEVEDPPLTAKCWMNEARNLSYGMEDYINSLLFVQPEDPSKLVASNIKTTRSLRKSSSNVKAPKNQLIIAETLSEFRMYIQEAIERHQRHNLQTCSTLRHRFVSPGPMLLPTPYEETADVVIDGRMNEFINSLANDGDQQLKVLSVLGPACLGKTTLARVLYSRLGKQYHCRVFVRVSKKPDMKRIFREMLSQLQRQHSLQDCKEIDLIDNIKTYLQNKRYLIIVDDVWATSVWDIINHAFPKGNHGSRIITTTQIEDVALTCCCYQSEYVFEMKHLDDDHSRKLFFNRLFGSESDCPEQFKEILNEIIEICDGLPLAIISIASLLASQPVISIDLLKYIHQTLISCFSASERMRQALNLGFNNLPHYLKTCLLYLIMYPEGYTFYNDDFVKQWMAESFIHRTEGQDMVKVAQSYLDQLIARGFIQPIRINYNNEVVSCAIHDMVHDLIAHKSAEENFIVAIDYTQKSVSLSHKVRRLSLLFGTARYAKTPANITKSQVRSLAYFGLLECMPCIKEFKLLRILNLQISGNAGKDNPVDLTGVLKLLQLRYLKIGCGICIKLPADGLQCLETLDITNAIVLDKECGIHLPRLLHLSLPFGTSLLDWICFRKGTGRLNYLEDIHLTSHFTAAYDLQRYMEALSPLIGGHGNLRTVVLAHGSTVKNTVVRGAPVVITSLDDLAPPPLLQRFEFSLHRSCIFSRIPPWVKKHENLSILKIAVKELQMICVGILRGLPALTALSLYVETAPVDKIILDMVGFSVLKYFKLRFLTGIAWLKFEEDSMPNLSKLKLVFNAIPQIDEYEHGIISIGHMPGLRDITVRFGGIAVGSEYDLVINHPRNPMINKQSTVYRSYSDESGKQKQLAYEILEEERDEIVEAERDETVDKERAEYYKELSSPADQRISRLPESFSGLHDPVIGKVRRMVLRVAHSSEIGARLRGEKCKRKILSTVSKLDGLESIDIQHDQDYGGYKLTVVGTVDPLRIVKVLKKRGFAAHVVGIEKGRKKLTPHCGYGYGYYAGMPAAAGGPPPPPYNDAPVHQGSCNTQ